MNEKILARFKNKVAVVIGGATGIGAATARRLALEDAQVVIADIAADGARELAETITRDGGVAIGVTCDIGDETSVAALFATAIKTFGGIDAVHVNAADLSMIPFDTDASTVPLEVFDRTIEINLRGHLLCTRHAIPVLLQRGGGSIVYTSSRGGITSETVRVSYSVSKSGIHALMRHTALAWGKEGIRANVVAPGTILTAPLLKLGEAYIQERSKAVQTSRLGRPEDVAAGVAFLLSDDAAFINGQILSIDGGVTMR
jgi:NAD(P)-dependent dehydrogenase (short-subunit alcohol dehydrogenase family)